MSNRPISLTRIVISLFLLSFPGISPAQDSRFLPGVGREAVHQRALDASSNAVVLMVALQPGYEDLNLLARLRLGLGARTFVVYWTNGEATPDDFRGDSPGFLAASRREEAFRAASLLGAQTHFLNLPDPGVVSRQEELRSIWQPDSIIPKLKGAIRSYGPDVVIICGDFRGDSVRSMRQQHLTALMLDAVREAAARAKDDSAQTGPWRTARVLVAGQPGKDHGPEYDRTHPLWKMSYRQIAGDAAGFYGTLRYQLPSWMGRGDPTYTQVFPSVAAAPKQLLAGVPVLSPRLKPLASLVRNAAGKETRGVRTTSLAAVARVIDTLNFFIARSRPALPWTDMRVISTWKNGLEDLRCSLLDVSVSHESTDTLVTRAQVFTLKFTGYSSRTARTGTSILFPGVMEKKWGVNESATYQYDFNPPQEFRVITPPRLEFDYPVPQLGITRPFARTRFSFIVFHRDSVPARDFVYRDALLLHASPIRTFELLTPAVRALDGEPVVYRLQNVSRDGFAGSISLIDSNLHPTTKEFQFSAKDGLIVDTLFLSFRGPPPPGTSTVLLSLSGMGGEIPVVVRRFDADVDSSARVALVTAIDDSPLAQAMHRLHVPFRQAGRDAAAGDGQNVLVLDRDALAGVPLTAARAESLTAWVRRGGHLVIFPQVAGVQGLASVVPWASFAAGPLSAPGDSVSVTAAHPFLSTPNVIEPADWSNWVISRSMSPVRFVSAQSDADVPVRTSRGENPLLVTRKEGAGRITLVGLDLASQLMNIHPGAYRLLANLLRAGQ